MPSLAFLPLGGELRGVLLGACVATIVGAVDDFRGLNWWQKLGGQVLAAAIPTTFGVWVQQFTFPIVGIHALPAWFGVPLTIIGIVALMNMVNFLDGLDGLAAGRLRDLGRDVLRDRAVARARSAPRRSPRSSAVPASGSCVTTSIRHASSWATRARCCSATRSAAIAVQGLLKTAALATLVLPLLVLAVPVLDTSFVVAKRLKNRQPIYVADARHLHHRFMRIGFSQRRAVVYLYAWCVMLALAALATRFAPPHHHGRWSMTNLVIDVLAGLGRDRLLALRRLPARDRQADEPAGPPPRTSFPRRLSAETAAFQPAAPCTPPPGWAENEAR